VETSPEFSEEQEDWGLPLKGKILKLLMEHGVLNGYQICRLLNGKDKDEYEWCYFSFKEKPFGSSPPHHKPCKNFVQCNPKVTQVYSCLHRMKIQSRKMVFHDKGGIGRDLFRFWFIEEKEFEKQILRQTLIPYITA